MSEHWTGPEVPGKIVTIHCHSHSAGTATMKPLRAPYSPEAARLRELADAMAEAIMRVFSDDVARRGLCQWGPETEALRLAVVAEKAYRAEFPKP